MIFIIIGFAMIIIPSLCYAIWALFIDPIKTFIKAKKRLKDIPKSSTWTKHEIILDYELAVKDIKGMIVIIFVIVSITFIGVGAYMIQGG